ncbi:MAG: magnesium transporter [Gammaproteobacteria bacterium]|nr:magnesium transporter [Gammaproteobacteria bacterium]
MEKKRLPRPRELAQRLATRARKKPEEVEAYLDSHTDEWAELAQADPHDAADILEELGDEAAADLIRNLLPPEAADILEEMQDDLAADVLEEVTAIRAASLIEAMPPAEAADLIGALEPEHKERILSAVSEKSSEAIRHLLSYPPDSAGGLMTLRVATLPVGLTAGEAIERIRQLHEEIEDLSYVYVVDDLGRLVGVLSFRELVFARPGDGLDEVMVHNPVKVTPLTDREQVAELTRRYNLFSVPVVDFDDRLLGIVTVDEVIDAVEQEAGEDFAVAMGAGGEETVFTPVRRSIRMRMPWLFFDLALSGTVSLVVATFQTQIAAAPLLASLMPLVARIGGDSGAMSLAVVIRGLATRDISPNRTVRVITRELALGFSNGFLTATLSGLIAAALLQDPHIGLVIFISVLANLIVAGLAGSALPLVLRRLGFDPALGSNLFVTTITDLTGFGGFLLVASLLL